MLAVSNLGKTYIMVMLYTVRTVRLTAGIYQYFSFSLIFYFFKQVKFIVEIVVNNDNIVLFVKLII